MVGTPPKPLFYYFAPLDPMNPLSSLFERLKVEIGEKRLRAKLGL